MPHVTSTHSSNVLLILPQNFRTRCLSLIIGLCHMHAWSVMEANSAQVDTDSHYLCATLGIPPCKLPDKLPCPNRSLLQLQRATLLARALPTFLPPTIVGAMGQGLQSNIDSLRTIFKPPPIATCSIPSMVFKVYVILAPAALPPSTDKISSQTAMAFSYYLVLVVNTICLFK